MKSLMDQLDFDFSRPIDIQRNIDLEVLRSFSEYFSDQKDNQLFLKHIKLLIVELYLSWMEDKDQFLSVSMSKRGYRLNSRYNPNNISSYLIKTIRFLESKKLIELYPGFFDAKRKKSRLTRIRSSKTLCNHFRKIKLESIRKQLCYIHLNHKKKENLFMLKEGNLSEYKDNFETKELQDTLENYNKLISKTLFDIPNLEKSFLVRGDQKKIAISSFSSCTYSFDSDYKDKIIVGGCWWNKIDLNLFLQIKNRLIVNNQPTSHIDLLDFFGEFLSHTYGININIQPRLFSEVLNYDQVCYLIMKGIRSKNHKSFIRSVFNEKKRLSIHDLPEIEIKKSIKRNILEERMVSQILFGGQSVNWKEFVSKFFFDLIKRLNNVEIPIFLVREKIFFPDAMHRIILDKIEEIIEKRIKKKPVKITTRKSLPFKFEKGSFFGRFVKTKLNFSKRYLMKKKLFVIE